MHVKTLELFYLRHLQIAAVDLLVVVVVVVVEQQHLPLLLE
jgi:hypothetical protein